VVNTPSFAHEQLLFPECSYSCLSFTTLSHHTYFCSEWLVANLLAPTFSRAKRASKKLLHLQVQPMPSLTIQRVVQSIHLVQDTPQKTYSSAGQELKVSFIQNCTLDLGNDGVRFKSEPELAHLYLPQLCHPCQLRFFVGRSSAMNPSYSQRGRGYEPLPWKLAFLSEYALKTP